MREKKLTGILLLILFLSVLVGACATGSGGKTSGVTANESFIAVSYKTLVTAADVYETSMKTAGALYQRGILNEAQKEQIIKVAKKYHDAWHAARNALEEYKKAETPGNKTLLETALNSYFTNQAELLQTLKNNLGGL